jgi:hypothetical protein
MSPEFSRSTKDMGASSHNNLEGIRPGDGHQDVDMCPFTAKNSENGEERAHLIYEGLDYRSLEFNIFEGDV